MKCVLCSKYITSAPSMALSIKNYASLNILRWILYIHQYNGNVDWNINDLNVWRCQIWTNQPESIYIHFSLSKTFQLQASACISNTKTNKKYCYFSTHFVWSLQSLFRTYSLSLNNIIWWTCCCQISSDLLSAAIKEDLNYRLVG